MASLLARLIRPIPRSMGLIIGKAEAPVKKTSRKKEILPTEAESKELINIFKDKKDPEIFPLEQYPPFLQELAYDQAPASKVGHRIFLGEGVGPKAQWRLFRYIKKFRIEHDSKLRRKMELDPDERDKMEHNINWSLFPLPNEEFPKRRRVYDDDVPYENQLEEDKEDFYHEEMGGGDGDGDGEEEKEDKKVSGKAPEEKKIEVKRKPDEEKQIVKKKRTEKIKEDIIEKKEETKKKIDRVSRAGDKANKKPPQPKEKDESKGGKKDGEKSGKKSKEEGGAKKGGGEKAKSPSKKK